MTMTTTTTPTIVIGSADLPRDGSPDYQPEEVNGIVYEVTPTKPEPRQPWTGQKVTGRSRPAPPSEMDD